MTKVFLFGLLGGVVAGIFAIVGNSQTLTVLAIGLVLASIEVMVLTKMADGFTPLVIPVLTINGILLSAPFLWNEFQDAAHQQETITMIFPAQTGEYLIDAAVIGIVFSAAFTVGAILAGPRRVNISLAQLQDSFRVPNGILVGVGYGGILLEIYGYQGSLLQGRYLESQGPDWAVKLSQGLAPFAILALCIVAAKQTRWRTLAVAGVGLWFAILFGRSTRLLAGLPAMIVLGASLGAGRAIRTRPLVIAAVATVFLLQVALLGRFNLDGVGIIALGEQLSGGAEELSYSSSALKAALGNVWFSAPQTVQVANRPIASELLWSSLNPMPGVLTNWDEIQVTQRLNAVTPYNGLGELRAHGWVTLALVAAFMGFSLSLSNRVASSLRGAHGTAALILVLAIVGLFSVTVLQYNLRTNIRLVWYALFLVAAIWFFQRIFSRKRAESARRGDWSA